jgi:hypothetical protein
VIVFVSYSRLDNDEQRLRELEFQLGDLGELYIDDLHHSPNGDRVSEVHRALDAAGAFVSILSENYLKTEWTSKELAVAKRRGIPIYSLLPDGDLRAIPADEVVGQWFDEGPRSD